MMTAKSFIWSRYYLSPQKSIGRGQTDCIQPFDANNNKKIDSFIVIRSMHLATTDYADHTAGKKRYMYTIKCNETFIPYFDDPVSV